MATSLIACAGSLESVIQNSKISKQATVAVSVRKLSTGNVVFEKNSHKLLNPASTLKAFTTPVIFDQLGDNYDFKTQIYKSGENVYLKLSADPTLNLQRLKDLVSALRGSDIKKPQRFYIDDTVTDDLEFGIGWMWDDEFSPFMPKYSRYNLDGNVYTLTLKPSVDNKSVEISKPYGYNIIVVNNLKIGSQNKVNVSRNFWDGVEKVTLSGTISGQTFVKIPTYNQKRYFLSMLQYNMNYSNVNYLGSFDSKKTPADAILLKEIVTPVSPMYSMILKDSNNMVCETLFKIAGAKYTNLRATTQNGINALNDYYKKLGINIDDIVVVDASGVSRNDLLSTDWMSEALYKINKNDKNFDYKARFNIPNEGTMNNRLFDLRGNLWAKTGTLANTSGLTGYILTKSGHEYAFAILIQNTNEPISEAKKLEDEIVNTIYNKY